jgi:predicted nucleic acid-binding protein
VPRVVVDTNVLVSSFFGGKPREVMELWRDGQFVLCLSDDILAELGRPRFDGHLDSVDGNTRSR